jgi:hypothetical protein
MHHVILADSIDGGILMILLIGCGLAVSVLALIGLIPAWQGSRSGTLVLAGPAFLAGIAATIYCVWWVFFGAGPGDRGDRGLFLALWAILAGPPIATSLLAVICLWLRRARQRVPALER